jgi:NAD(P)H dehydrogenase (quinone)
MSAEVVGVTGSTGGLGSRIIENLRSNGHHEVVALARRPDAISGHARSTARFADYEDPESMHRAFSGIKTLVFVSSDGDFETMQRHHERVICSAIAAGIEHVVYTSIIDIEADSGFAYSQVHLETEQLLAGSGIPHTLARTSIFTDFFVSTWLEPALVDGILAIPAGSGRISLVCRDDVAEALAHLALDRSATVVNLTGPAAVGTAEVCKSTEDVLGGSLRYDDVSNATYRAMLEQAGEPAWLVEAFASMFASVMQGRFEATSGDMERMIGRAPRSFADFLTDSR